MTSAARAPSSVITMKSGFDFEATLSRLKQALTSRGMTIFADIDQAAAAVAASTSLRPTRLLLFGNPKGGTPVMEANPHAALELPLKLVVWQAPEGAVQVDYLEPAAMLVEHYGIDAAFTGVFAQVPSLLAQAIDADQNDAATWR
ncbi:DUF302 domain-containing protein [Paraburkholderia sp. DHOC27]|uniref:DUF302 domain-containing protein n=1 Tax=Paraburkholderia sp. DHOC27 TaxID=2303330 RepID=UPI0015F30416|nr:DUF302 domain-containing protein [Paraburkholderia sp. DHOC27]